MSGCLLEKLARKGGARKAQPRVLMAIAVMGLVLGCLDEVKGDKLFNECRNRASFDTPFWSWTHSWAIGARA